MSSQDRVEIQPAFDEVDERIEKLEEQIRQLREEGQLQARLNYVSYCCLSVAIAICFALVIVL